MKKTLLFFGLLLSFGLSAQQTLDATNHYQNLYDTYFVCDTTGISTLIGTTGSNVTWDYSNLTKITDSTEVFTILDSAEAAYPSMNMFANLGGFMIQKLERNSDSVVALMMNINDPENGNGLGIVNAYFTTQPTLIKYPMVFGDQISTTINGTADALTFGQLGKPLTGNHTTIFDGFGTLKLNQVTVDNVIRLIQIDTLIVDTQDPNVGNANVIMTSIEYFNIYVSSAPIFVVRELKFTLSTNTSMGFSTLNIESKYDPAIPLTVSAKSINSSVQLETYPNPAQDNLTFSGNFDQAMVQIVDESGKVIYQGIVVNGSTISTATFNKGVYIVKAYSNKGIITNKMVKM